MALVDFAQGICLSWFPEVYKQLNNFNSRRINKAISRGLTRAIHAGFEHDRLPEKKMRVQNHCTTGAVIFPK